MTHIHQLAHQIANFMHDWQAEPRYDHNAFLVGPGGRKLMLRLKRDRLHASGVYPRHGTEAVISSYDDPPKITVNPKRKPKAIAADLLRRLLPRYEEMFKLAQERAAFAEAQERAIKDHVGRLTAIVGQPFEESEVYINQRNPQNDANLYGRFIVRGRNRIELNLRGLSLAQALALARALKLPPNRPGQRYSVYYHRQPTFQDSGLYGTTRLVTSDLPHTHALVTHRQAHGLDDLYRQMQAENWSPKGEARAVIEAAGVGHTSLSIGDVVRDRNGTFWECVTAGWRRVEADQPVGDCWQCDQLRPLGDEPCPHCQAASLPF